MAKAISDKKSQRDLYITKMSGCSSILKPDYEAIKKNLSNPEKFIEWYEIEKTIKVDTDNIANICKLNKIKPSVIKIDIQGAEYEALLGAKEILDSCCLLLIETSLKNFQIFKPSKYLQIFLNMKCRCFRTCLCTSKCFQII